jgi:hypothetical protein
MNEIEVINHLSRWIQHFVLIIGFIKIATLSSVGVCALL